MVFVLSIHSPVILVPGVGSVRANEGENEEEDEELDPNIWMTLLDSDDDGVLSLKSWRDVSAAKANKTNIALALRAVMRQAWSVCSFLSLLSLLISVIQSSQAEEE